MNKISNYFLDFHVERRLICFRISGAGGGTHRVDGVDEFSRFAELHEALSEVVERSLHQNLLLLVVVQQVVPQRLLRERLGVPHDYHAVPSHKRTQIGLEPLIKSGMFGIWLLVISLGSGQRHVETTRVVQETDALVLVCTNTRQDDEVLLSALEGIHAGNLHLL